MSDEARATRRWMYLWIAIGVVVVLVVIGFLIPISSSLRSIDTGLDHTVPPVKGVRGDVDPLGADVDRVNGALARIHAQLRPLPRQAHAVISNLSAIDGSLGRGEGALAATAATLRHTDGALGDTATTLDSTSARLSDTETTLNATQSRLATVVGTLATLSGTLTTTLTLAGGIERTLVAAQRPASAGSEAIWRRVQVLNGGRFSRRSARNTRGLRGIDTNGRRIDSGLVAVNDHLQSICESVPLRTLSQLGGGGGQPVSDPSAPARC